MDRRKPPGDDQRLPEGDFDDTEIFQEDTSAKPKTQELAPPRKVPPFYADAAQTSIIREWIEGHEGCR